jgi:cytochrome c-type biogenesis protein CcmH/NrfG
MLALLLVPLAASAAPGDGGAGEAAIDPVIERAWAAFGREDWGGAARQLQQALAVDAANPEYHNLYAYALRKGPNPDMNLVFRHYNEALRLSPEHRQAHEYLGEAYLMVGNVAKAKEQLAVLDRLCLFSCKEYRDLKEAIARHEAKR